MNITQRITDKVLSQGKARSTAEAYSGWVIRYLEWCKQNHVGKETRAEDACERYLSWLANSRHVSSTTQNQAFASLCYFYKHVLGRPLEGVRALRAKKVQTCRDSLHRDEIAALLNELQGVPRLAAELMYGCGLRIGEVGNLRIKDLNFKNKQIHVHASKGKKSRLVPFPECVHERASIQKESMRVLWKHDMADGLNGVDLPNALGRKASSWHTSFEWYYLFCSDHCSKSPDDGRLYRHHVDTGHLGRQITDAAKRAGIERRVTAHWLRHSNATHLLENNTSIHVVKELLGHEHISTTETYIHAQADGITATKSPLADLVPKINLGQPAQPYEPFQVCVLSG